MAEMALYLALKKINLVTQRDDSYDVTRLVIFKSRLRRIESELRMIHSFLETLETRYNRSELQLTWIAEAQKMGLLVEETVDACIQSHFLTSGKLRQQLKHEILSSLLRPCWSRLTSSGDKAVTQLTELEKELEHLSRMKKQWFRVASESQRPYITSNRETANLSYKQLVSDFINEEPVGFDEKISMLADRLLSHKYWAHRMVAVYGPPGSGKTTLVNFVYERERSRFDCSAWISLSGCSGVEDTLIKIRWELRLCGETTFTGRDTVRSAGLMKKFLIVFDDIKVTEGISDICDSLPTGSRIIIVTKLKYVADHFDEDCIRLGGLDDESAYQLFGRVVLGKRSEITEALREIYNNVMKTCSKGLPQVVISLGATLSWKQNAQSTFNQVRQQLEWVSESNSSLDDTHKCLYVAYINLPTHLKVCLLYCGIFPAGHLLLHEKLVRLFVAEGYVQKRASEVEEVIAEGYLIELTRRGFLQQVQSDELGRVASLRMPIVVHELVQSICIKEGFGIASDDAELAQADSNVRCLFVAKYPHDTGSLTDLTHLRTLITSESAAAYCPPPQSESFIATQQDGIVHFLQSTHLKNHRYITVLELQGSPLERIPDTIGDLFNLRYLGLRKTQVRYLPRSMSRLYNLYTLDLESSNITELPDWIGQLARLRHLLAGRSSKEHQTRGVRAAKSVKNLKELRTLETVESSADFVKSVDMLMQLKSLCISNVDGKTCRILFANLSKIGSLTRLALTARDGSEVLNLNELRSKQLKSLELSCCRLAEDSLGVLSNNLHNLVSLSLSNVSGIKKLKFQKDYFTELRTLIVREMRELEGLVIVDGALASLKVLHMI